VSAQPATGPSTSRQQQSTSNQAGDAPAVGQSPLKLDESRLTVPAEPSDPARRSWNFPMFNHVIRSQNNRDRRAQEPLCHAARQWCLFQGAAESPCSVTVVRGAAAGQGVAAPPLARAGIAAAKSRINESLKRFLIQFCSETCPPDFIRGGTRFASIKRLKSRN